MKVTIEYMDGRMRTYTLKEASEIEEGGFTSVADGVLYLFDCISWTDGSLVVPTPSEIIIPLVNVRSFNR